MYVCSVFVFAGQAPNIGWRIVKVGGDGDCLFHALAFLDSCDGRALRIEVANFMHDQASTEVGFEEELRREAAKLRAGRWGGHTAITAYSRMKSKRVMVHTWRPSDGSVAVEEMSHASIHGKGEASIAHIFYNGVDHYDALLGLLDLSGMEAAWPQPQGPAYFKKSDSSGSHAVKRGLRGKQQASKTGTGVAVKKRILKEKPPKQSKAASKPKPSSKGSTNKRKSQPKPGAEPRDEPMPAEPSQPQPQSEAGDAGDAKPGLMEELEGIAVASTSEHPHRKLEDLIKDQAWCERVLVLFLTLFETLQLLLVHRYP